VIAPALKCGAETGLSGKERPGFIYEKMVEKFKAVFLSIKYVTV
jgi:hypothetical protein